MCLLLLLLLLLLLWVPFLLLASSLQFLVRWW